MFCMELYFRKTGFSSGKSPQWADKWGEKTAGEQRTAVFFDGEQCVGECEVHFVSGEADNLRARHFYKKNGFSREGTTKSCYRKFSE